MMMAIINLINQYFDQDVKRDDVYDLHPPKVKMMDEMNFCKILCVPCGKKLNKYCRLFC